MYKVYISGRMDGVKDFNKNAFMDAEKKLVKDGNVVFNPYRAYKCWRGGFDIKDGFAVDMAALSHCDVIYMLNGWEESAGARIEYDYAVRTGMRIIYDKKD